ncbi:MAG: thioredoxin-disulfide reductase [Bacteroidetes bacterium]|nr:thioredoxin-disulfide reductase [Bacteroidota bacterium]
MEHRKVIIIGSGPAGLTAALYTGRANLAPLVFEGNQPGGQLTITTEVENFPGFPEGITGPQLMDEMRKQAQRFGAESKFEHVTAVDLSQRPFKVMVGEAVYTADSVIVSTGASAKLLGLESEKEFMGYGVSACATCDGFFFRNQEVAVVGGGDTAMEEALYLTKFASKVTIIHRRGELRASKIMGERAEKNGKVEFKWFSTVEDIKGTEENGIKKLTHLVLKNTETGELEDFKTDGLFMGIGHRPNTDLFVGMLDMDENGYLIPKDRSTYTNIEGVFACGDVQDHVYRQAISAAGSGCMAAIDAERWLAAQGIE